MEVAIRAVLAIEDSPAPSQPRQVYYAWTAHDKLTDFIDYVEMMLLDQQTAYRRSGKSSFNDSTANPFRPALDVAQAIDAVRDLPAQEQRLVVDVAKRLREALAPRAGRRIDPETGESVARGTVQVKHIKGRPYLYYRYWVSAGGKDRKQRRLKSKYIGKPILAAILSGIQDEDRKKQAIHTITMAYLEGTLETLAARVNKATDLMNYDPANSIKRPALPAELPPYA